MLLFNINSSNDVIMMSRNNNSNKYYSKSLTKISLNITNIISINFTNPIFIVKVIGWFVMTLYFFYLFYKLQIFNGEFINTFINEFTSQPKSINFGFSNHSDFCRPFDGSLSLCFEMIFFDKIFFMIQNLISMRISSIFI